MLEKCYTFALTVVLVFALASCGKPKLKSNPDEADSIAIVTEKEAKSSSEKSAFPQINAFTDYVYNDFHVFTFSDTIGILQQLDIEFPTGMKDKKVLAKIQEQLIDTVLHAHYQITQLDEAMAKYWRIEPNDIELKSVYPLIVPNDSDEYFNYGGVQSRQFEHLCGRTSYNQNGLYIMRHHYTWYGGGCHHFPDTRYFAFDTRTGEMVHFTDIFSERYDDHEKKMTVDIEYYVIKALLDHYYPNISLQYWIHASFTITSTSLVLHYTHYTLGSWADGEQEVEIPLESLKPLLNPKWKHLIP